MREERPAVVAGDVREPPLARAVGLHDVDLGEVAGVDFELLLLGVAERPVVGVAHRRERDPLAVRRVAAFSVVPPGRRQARQLAGAAAVDVDVHLGVVVPGVAALLAGGAERVLLVLILLRFRIGVRGGELDVAVGAGPEERAGRLAQARRDPFRVAALEIERVDLVEGIAGLAFALEHEALAVGRPVAFAGALALDGQAPDARQEVALFEIRRCGQREEEDGERERSTQFDQHRDRWSFAFLPRRRPPTPQGPRTRPPYDSKRHRTKNDTVFNLVARRSGLNTSG